MIKTMVVTVAAFAMALTISGCACWKEKAQTPQCVVVKQIIDCTVGEAKDLVPSMLPVIMALISGGNPDWDLVLEKLKAMGFKDAGCILAALEADFMSNQKMSATPEGMTKVAGFKSKWSTYREANYKGIQFKFIGPDGKEVLR